MAYRYDGASLTDDPIQTTGRVWIGELRGRLDAFRWIGAQERGGYARWADEQAVIIAEELRALGVAGVA